MTTEERLAAKIVGAVLHDLGGRQGIGDALGDIPPWVEAEMRKKLTSIVQKLLAEQDEHLAEDTAILALPMPENAADAALNLTNMVTLGQIAYDAYCDKRDWKSVRGDPLPKFSEQSPELQEAWEAAAEAVAVHYAGKSTDE